jgi:small ligand-binding sensory domain FIST
VVDRSKLRAASAVVLAGSPQAALQRGLDQLVDRLAGRLDALVYFVSGPAGSAVSGQLAELLERDMPEAIAIGSVAEGVVGTAQEVEGQSAVSLIGFTGLAADRTDAFHLHYESSSDGFVGLPDRLWEQPDAASGLVILADPYSFPADRFFQRCREEFPSLPVVGGFASGLTAPKRPGLMVGGKSFREGAVGWLLPPQVKLAPIVSQGCRPIGEPLVVTAVQGPLLVGLGGRPALDQLNDLFRRLPTRDQRLALEALHVGKVISEYRERFTAGDFLIRNLLGASEDPPGLLVADPPRVGQTIQFHIRDAETADADLAQLLAAWRAEHPSSSVVAGLLFTCNGRGSRLFSAPHHDAAALERYFPGLPLAGMFAAGEFGPIGGHSFVHGFTAVTALLTLSQA